MFLYVDQTYIGEQTILNKIYGRWGQVFSLEILKVSNKVLSSVLLLSKYIIFQTFIGENTVLIIHSLLH